MLLVLVLVGLVFSKKYRGGRFGDAYCKLTGMTSLPLPATTLNIANHAEFSIKVGKHIPPRLDRLLVQIVDYDMFERHIPTREMRAWFDEKTPPCPRHAQCESFPYMIAADGNTKKIYWENGTQKGMSGMSFSSDGVERKYVRVSDPELPSDIRSLLPLSKRGRAHTRSTPGVPVKSYYLRLNTEFNEETVEKLCVLAEKRGVSHVDTLREWMIRARDLQMIPSWVQFTGAEMTVYARLKHDNWQV